MDRAPRITFVIGIILHVGAIAAQLYACEGRTVRDAAFDGPRDVHRLCVFAGAGDAAAGRICDRLDLWLRGSGKDLNVELIRVDADEPNIVWGEFGIPSAPPSMPVTALVGRRLAERRSFVIDHWEPAPSAEDLAALETSPAREALRRELGRCMAVLLYIPATSAEAGAAEPILRQVAKTWSAQKPLGVAVVRADRSDRCERLLLAFTGAARTDREWVAVVFGRGKFMPPLIGEEITEAGLNENLESLTSACTCLRSPSMLGVDVPMAWEAALDLTISRLDPNTPLIPRPSGAGLADEAGMAAGRSPILPAMLWTLTGLAIVVAAVTAGVFWRQRRDGTRSSAH